MRLAAMMAIQRPGQAKACLSSIPGQTICREVNGGLAGAIRTYEQGLNWELVCCARELGSDEGDLGDLIVDLSQRNPRFR